MKTAIALDPEFARAYWLLAKIYLATGQADLADAAAAEACDIEPKNASFQLCHAQARELLGEYDDAVLTVRAVLDREDLAQIDRAQALHQMARLASLGDREIASKTIPFETRAIEIADKLATSKDARERRAAKAVVGRSARRPLPKKSLGSRTTKKSKAFRSGLAGPRAWRRITSRRTTAASSCGCYIAQHVLTRWPASSRRSTRRRGWPKPRKPRKRCSPNRTTKCGSST